MEEKFIHLSQTKKYGIQNKDSSYSIVNTEDNKVIYTFTTNYCPTHTFLIKNISKEKQQEWFIAGESKKKLMINLDKEKIYNYSSGLFPWIDIYISPDGNTLAVNGGMRGSGDYYVLFYDFTNPEKEWPQLKLEYTHGLPTFDVTYLGWVNNTFVYEYSREFNTKFNKYEDWVTDKEMKEMPNDDDEYEKLITFKVWHKVIFKREMNSLIVLSEWKCEDKIRCDENFEKRWKK